MQLLYAGPVVFVVGSGLPSSAGADTWRFEPSAAARGTWTDNVDLQPADIARSDWITELAPGLRVRGQGGRVQLDAEYQPTAVVYARQSDLNEIQHALNATGSVEAIENFLFVDGRAEISRQTISAFGAQAPSNISATANQTEVRSLALSPNARGLLGSWGAYAVRYQAAATSAREGDASDGRAFTWSGRLQSATPVASFTWMLDYNNVRSDFDRAADTRYRVGRGTLTYHADPTMWVYARLGAESNDFRSGVTTTDTTHGIGLEWAPTGQSRVSLENDRRFFGRGYRYSVRHRTPRSAWSLQATRDVTTSIEQLTGASVGALFERFAELLTTEVADPLARAERVREVLTRTGISGEGIPQVGFLTAGVSLQRRVEASVAIMGRRNTWALAGHRNDSTSLTDSQGTGVLSGSSSAVVERGMSLSWNHLLTAHSSVTGTARWVRNTGSGTGSAEADQQDYSAMLRSQVGPRTTGSLGMRHVRFNGEGASVADYRENAVFGVISHRF